MTNVFYIACETFVRQTFAIIQTSRSNGPEE